MPEPLLCLEEVSAANQICGDCVSKPVKADALEASFIPKFREPVAESAGGGLRDVDRAPPGGSLAAGGAGGGAGCRHLGRPGAAAGDWFPGFLVFRDPGAELERGAGMRNQARKKGGHVHHDRSCTAKNVP